MAGKGFSKVKGTALGNGPGHSVVSPKPKTIDKAAPKGKLAKGVFDSYDGMRAYPTKTPDHAKGPGKPPKCKGGDMGGGY